MDLFQKIKTFKDGKVKDNSIRSYVIPINKLFGSSEYKTLNFLKKTDDIMEKIDEFENIATRKNYMNAIVVSLQSIGDYETAKFYVKKREQLRKVYDKELDKNIKTIKQGKNWMTLQDLKDIAMNLRKEVVRQKLTTTKKIEEITLKDLMLFQEYIISLLYTEMPPVRLDYTPMDIIYGPDMCHLETNKNYLHILNRSNKEFILNSFKTDKSFPQKIIKVPRKLNRILNRWIDINPTKYFLITQKLTPMSENLLGKTISKIFTKDGRSASLNIIRHIVASETVDIDKTKQQIKLAGDMLHSSGTQLLYAKN